MRHPQNDRTQAVFVWFLHFSGFRIRNYEVERDKEQLFCIFLQKMCFFHDYSVKFTRLYNDYNKKTKKYFFCKTCFIDCVVSSIIIIIIKMIELDCRYQSNFVFFNFLETFVKCICESGNGQKNHENSVKNHFFSKKWFFRDFFMFYEGQRHFTSRISFKFRTFLQIWIQWICSTRWRQFWAVRYFLTIW